MEETKNNVTSPAIEKIERKEDKTIEIVDESLAGDMSLIQKNPYKYICDYVESLYPNVGKKSFEILSLLPASLIMPDIEFGGRLIRSNLHVLVLGASGGGKSSIADMFAKFAFNSLNVESITSAGLESAIMNSGSVFSLIVGDFARMSRDPILMKVLEGILGEEKSIKRKTARKDMDLDVDAVALLCGVSSDLSKYIMSGMLWRISPIMLGNSVDEHMKIGRHLINQVGKSGQSDKTEVIKNYYYLLLKMQSNKETGIKGYSLPKEFGDNLLTRWEKMTKPYVKELGLNFFRELLDGIRFLFSHAYLNRFNRKVENGILHPNEEDFRISMKLMKQSIAFKFRLIRSESFSKGLKDANDFKRIMESEKVSEQVKDMIRGLVEIKGNKVIQR